MAARRGLQSRIPFRILLPSAAVLALLAAGAVEVGAAGRCRDLACHAELVVASRWRTVFHSPETFQSERERVSVRLFAAAQELATTSTAGPAGCRRHLRGAGVEAAVNVCGPGTVPVRVRAKRRGGEPIEVDVVYRARPRGGHGVKGIEAGSGDGSGGVGAPASGGVGAPRPR